MIWKMKNDVFSRLKSWLMPLKKRKDLVKSERKSAKNCFEWIYWRRILMWRRTKIDWDGKHWRVINYKSDFVMIVKLHFIQSKSKDCFKGKLYFGEVRFLSCVPVILCLLCQIFLCFFDEKATKVRLPNHYRVVLIYQSYQLKNETCIILLISQNCYF